MKNRLLLFGALALAGPAARAQSPWLTPPGTPTLYTGFLGNDFTLTPPRPEVPAALWGTYYQNLGLSSTAATVLSTSDDGRSWQSAQVASTSRAPGGSGATGSVAVSLEALNGTTAWLLRTTANNTVNPALLRTTSGPAGFTEVVPVLPANFSHLKFFDATTGVALALARNPTMRDSLWTMYRTTTAGLNWSSVGSVRLRSGEGIAASCRLGSSLWFLTTRGTLWHTADTGQTWHVTSLSLPSNPNSPAPTIAFTDARQGLVGAAGSSGPALWRTTDGGLTWAPVALNNPPLVGTLAAVPGMPGTYLSAGTVYAQPTYTSTGSSYLSRDYGASWQTLSTNDPYFGQLAIASPTHIWASLQYSYGGPAGPPAGQQMLTRYGGTALSTVPAVPAAASALVAYPNPATGSVQLAGPLTGTAQVRVYDVAGRLCHTATLSATQRTLDLSAQPAGLYRVTVAAASGPLRMLRISKL